MDKLKNGNAVKNFFHLNYFVICIIFPLHNYVMLDESKFQMDFECKFVCGFSWNSNEKKAQSPLCPPAS